MWLQKPRLAHFMDMCGCQVTETLYSVSAPSSKNDCCCFSAQAERPRSLHHELQSRRRTQQGNVLNSTGHIIAWNCLFTLIDNVSLKKKDFSSVALQQPKTNFEKNKKQKQSKKWDGSEMFFMFTLAWFIPRKHALFEFMFFVAVVCFSSPLCRADLVLRTSAGFPCRHFWHLNYYCSFLL